MAVNNKNKTKQWQ